MAAVEVEVCAQGASTPLHAWKNKDSSAFDDES